MNPRVSVIIVSWDGLALLQKCLPSVLATEYDNFEIVVVDNGSVDGSVEWLTQQDVTLLPQESNLGFCGGNNVGIAKTSSDFVVLLNNDVEVAADWLSELVAQASTEPTIAAVQPKILDYSDRTRFEYAGAAGGHLDSVGYPFASGRLFDTIETDEGQYDEPMPIFWASGAALLLRRSALTEVGLLDERLFMHMEEIDLCWRLWQAGYSVRLAPKSRVYHIGGASLAQGSPKKMYYNFRNSLLLLYKHTSPGRWPLQFTKRVLLDVLAVVRGMLVLRPRESWAIVRAYADAHKMKKGFDQDRPDNDEDTFRPSYDGSIAAQYFFLGRKRFQDLPTKRFQGPFRDRTR
ncbi:MAG: glycosyltransferase family 2 protein [Rhodothermales bacterium]|nr:glycosyltransferase family 2 protein [Rhodothermales bacterium]